MFTNMVIQHKTKCLHSVLYRFYSNKIQKYGMLGYKCWGILEIYSMLILTFTLYKGCYLTKMEIENIGRAERG